MGSYKSFFVFMVSIGSLRFLIYPYESLWVFMGPCVSVLVLFCPNGF